MIEAKLVKMGSEEDLETGEATFRLGFRLPTGDVIYADASADVVVKLRQWEERANTKAEDSVPVEAAVGDLVDVPMPQDFEAPEEPAPEMPDDAEVEWAKLPGDLLPDHVKTAMSALRSGGQALPPTMVLSQVLQIRDTILDDYTPDDWEKLGYQVEQSEPQGPPVGQIQWEEGQPQNPRYVPQRRAPADEKGNPIVQSNPNDVDPGEIAASEDDDGTGQF